MADSRGLPVLENCEGCGACCQVVVAPPFRIDHLVDEPRLRGVPPDLLEELLPLWEVRLVMPEAPCLWFDASTRACRHYELRPQACREFELNSYSCREIRRVMSQGEQGPP